MRGAVVGFRHRVLLLAQGKHCASRLGHHGPRLFLAFRHWFPFALQSRPSKLRVFDERISWVPDRRCRLHVKSKDGFGGKYFNIFVVL